MRTEAEKLVSRRDVSAGAALRFVVFLGVVSLFADMTYEGARSVTGPFLAVLGASGTVVGIVAGFGELVGYGLRLVSGSIADRTRRYWTITLIGYTVNMLAVPLLALAGRWEVAAFLIIAERTGKAMRNPPRDVMLSHATLQIGRGWGFGLHEALDQTGAVLGPLLVAGVLYLKGDYRVAFAALGISALLALGTLVAARITYPTPHDFEATTGAEIESTAFPRAYWLYLAAVALVAAGFADFPLIAYHFQKTSLVSPDLIPLYYALAMGVAGLGGLVFGRLFDRVGLSVLIAASLIAALFAPLVFFGGFTFALLGMVCWGIGLGAHESVMRAAVADFVPANRRGSAYGIFNAGYGLFWFLGSALIGILYDISIPWLVIFSVAAQLASIPVFLVVRREMSLRSNR
ncbi:MAG: MFS transporter [Chloroflexi bacterium]|nr:MFS transporter [Chloroflexota bacterium]